MKKPTEGGKTDDNEWPDLEEIVDEIYNENIRRPWTHCSLGRGKLGMQLWMNEVTREPPSPGQAHLCLPPPDGSSLCTRSAVCLSLLKAMFDLLPG